MLAANLNHSFNPMLLGHTFLLLAPTLVRSRPLADWEKKSVTDSTFSFKKSTLLQRDDESYSEKAKNWCNDNPSECNAVVSTLSIFGLFLIISVLFRYYRRRKRRQAVAKDSLQQTEAKAAQDALEQKVEERFFHRQREMKLRHDMEMLGLSNDKGK
ncbi:hypothetical protein IAS59_002707 [Cryptococcus gattii]